MVAEFPFENVLIPYRFFGFDSVMYLVSAIIGFLVSFYAFRLFTLAEKKFHFYLYLAFTVISMGLLTLSITSGYVYLNYFLTGTYIALDPYSSVDDFGYWIYYIASLVGYALLALIYLPEQKKSKLLPLLIFPPWYKGFPYFQILSFFLLSYVVFRSIANFSLNRNLNSLLVMLAFAGMSLFHLLLFFTSFSKIIYVVAHFSLLFGFLALLAMLVRVSRK